MKDPAFLYYDGDASKDVSHMNRLERGCYLDLIHAQRKFNGFTVEQARKILGKDFDSCWDSILLILSVENDVYFIEWVKNSINKRNEYAKIQKDRIQKYWDDKKNKVIPKKNDGNTTVIPIVNENEIVIENVINYLNNVLGTSYKKSSDKNKKHINARISEGYLFDDFKEVIDIKALKWGKDEKMKEYLRPETLFGTKFESYLQESKIKQVEQKRGLVR